MSYILDALKKSEQKRKQGEVPDLPASPPGGRDPKSKRPWWTIILGVALVINAALLGWWLMRDNTSSNGELRIAALPPQQPGQVPPKTPQTVQDPAKTSELPPSTLPERPMAQPADNLPRTESAGTGPPDQPPQTAVASLPDKVPVPASTTPAEEMASPEPALSEKRPAPSAAVDPPTEVQKDLYELNELPGHIRRLVPEMQVTLHFYTENPDARMVRINGMNLREGYAVSKDVRVEEITPAGVVFRMEGYRFQIPELSVGR